MNPKYKTNLKSFVYIFVLLGLIGCKPGDLKHERYVQNNTLFDTVIVVNPDFDDAIDTILPGNKKLIYSYAVLDTKQEFEACAWLGDSLIIRNMQDELLSRSVKIENFWSYTVEGDKDRIQKCTFVILPDDF